MGPLSITPETIPQKYKAGSRIEIFYDPLNAGSAVLTPGDHWMSFYAIAFGLAMCVLGGMGPVHKLLLWKAKRQLRRAEDEMRDFVANIQELGDMIDDCPNEAQRKELANRRKALIEEFQQLFGDYEQFAEELGEQADS